MIRLYNTQTNELVGEITDEQLGFLMDQLEEEFLEDSDYYFNSDTIALLANRGADPALVALLESVPHGAGLKEGFELRWSRS